MASSNIKLFDENKGNMLTDTEFNISTQRLNGLQTGVASSQLQNKAMYQASLVAYAIAQIMLQNGLNANDTDAVSAFVANLSGTLLQKVHDIATTEEAQAGVATGKWMSPALVKAAIYTLAAKAQNILSDETKALYELSTDAVPDDVFKMLVYASAAKLNVVGLTEADTVVAIKDGKTVSSVWDGKKHVFNSIRPLGTWTLDATREGGFHSTQDVLLDMHTVYTVSMNYKLMLYNDGDECIELTGGWEPTPDSKGTVRKNADHMYLSYYGNYVDVKTQNVQIANPGYKKYKALVSQYQDNAKMRFGPYGKAEKVVEIDRNGAWHEVSINISDVSTTPFYAMFSASNKSFYEGGLGIKKVWLEEGGTD